MRRIVGREGGCWDPPVFPAQIRIVEDAERVCYTCRGVGVHSGVEVPQCCEYFVFPCFVGCDAGVHDGTLLQLMAVLWVCTQCDDIPHAPLRNVRRGQHACSSSSSARMPCSVAQGWRVGGKVGFLCACTHACPCDHPLFMWALPQWHMPATIPHTDSTMPTISVIC
jgi:hypothetical protein